MPPPKSMKNSAMCFCETESLSDRKSTRLNSSHSQISYAVFCLKKKNHSLIVNLVRPVDIDTDVHTLTRVDSFDMHPAHAHEINVIGTLHLLAGFLRDGKSVCHF